MFFPKEEFFIFLDRKQMMTFLLNKTQFYVDRFAEFTTLTAYITGDHEDLVRIEGTSDFGFSKMNCNGID